MVDRRRWIGTKHALLRDKLADLARNVWQAERVVIDATGIGAGLAAFLAERLEDRSLGRVIPVDRFVFSEKSKSQLGWDFVGLIETGRYKEYVDPAPVGSAGRADTEAFWAELKGISFAVAAGPGQAANWSAYFNDLMQLGRHQDAIAFARTAKLRLGAAQAERLTEAGYLCEGAGFSGPSYQWGSSGAGYHVVYWCDTALAGQ